jgi:hypothetical protein
MDVVLRVRPAVARAGIGGDVPLRTGVSFSPQMAITINKNIETLGGDAGLHLSAVTQTFWCPSPTA